MRCSLVFTGDVDGPTSGFGERLLQAVEPLLQRIDAWKPGHLVAATYFDRYLKSPLTVPLALDFISAARSALSGGDPIQVELVSEPYRADGRYSDGQPWKITHDWRDDKVREAVVHALGDRLGLDLRLSLRRDQHARQIELLFNTGMRAVLVFDQGFGSWSLPSGISVRFDFNGDPVDQAIKLLNANVLLHGPTQPSYIVAHRR
jgi:DEAD/DEAH box helicase domain-containing protein